MSETPLYVKPLTAQKLTSGYLVDRGGKIHGGIDLISDLKPENRVVGAIGEGIVVYDFDGYNPKFRWDCNLPHSCGNFVKIAHKINGLWYVVRYVHLDRNLVSIGTYVTPGMPIGTYSDAGASHGQHIHMDMTDQYGRAINIEEFFSNLGIL